MVIQGIIGRSKTEGAMPVVCDFRSETQTTLAFGYLCRRPSTVKEIPTIS
jgi:hypothetical protein